jgi:aminopeptidase N
MARKPSLGSGATPGKLPSNVRPLAYRIDIVPDLDALASTPFGKEVDFKGRAEVEIEVLQPTETLTINANVLVFESAELDGERAIEICVHTKEEIVRLRFPRRLTTGPHKLTVAYAGKIITAPAGLFYSEYVKDPRSPPRRMLITQFEATDARRMFPAWDEPGFKATFALSIVLPREFRAVSNMPILREDDLPGLATKRTTFATTPKMSSYLAVLFASESGHVRQTVEDVDVGVITTPPRRAGQGRYALEQMTRILPYYNQYFGVPYPLPKLDLIAIPNFSATAMENWGGITYIDYSLLFDDANSGQATRELIFEVVAHEVAHQWFGNLVTMAWWEDLWLNEGFATWMQKKASDHLNPGWHIWLRAGDEKENVMAQDALRTAHSIQQKIADESEIDSAFDDITYRKGGAVIRMIEDYIGADSFQAGIRDYIREHAYGNAATADLWAALEKASGKELGKIAGSFVEQPGIPLIKVEAADVGGKPALRLTQERFTLNDPNAANNVWQVPVRIGRRDDAESQLIVVGDEPKTLALEGDGLMKANIGNLGYYRVQYAAAILQRLTAAYQGFNEADRVNLLADSWAMVQAGRAAAASYLDFTKQLSIEMDLAVWTSAVGTLREIDDLQRGEPGRDAFRAFACGLLRPVLANLGWEPKPGEESAAPLNALLRSLLIKAHGRFGSRDVIDEARRRFPTLQDQHKELREPIATVVGYVADAAIFNRLRQLGNEAPDTETKLRYYYALAGAGTAELIDKTVSIALTDELPSGRIDRFLVVAAHASA